MIARTGGLFNRFFTLFLLDFSCVNLIFRLQTHMPQVKCPQCSRLTEYEGNEFRPFCSERCKLLDFGAWADESYALPTDSGELSEEDVDRIERALKEREGK